MRSGKNKTTPRRGGRGESVKNEDYNVRALTFLRLLAEPGESGGTASGASRPHL